jgi:putative transposase
MSDVTNSIGSPTMTRSENKPSIAAVKELMGTNHDTLRKIVQDLLQEMLEGE